MTLDDYYHRASDAGTEHLAKSPDGPAFCGFEFDGNGELVLDASGGIDANAICKNCKGEVR